MFSGGSKENIGKGLKMKCKISILSKIFTNIKTRHYDILYFGTICYIIDMDVILGKMEFSIIKSINIMLNTLFNSQ